MPERPLLILPAPGEPAERRKKRGGGGQFHRPDRERQTERLTPRFEQLQRALDARRARLQTEAHGLVPEEVIVLETIGTVEGFVRAVEKVPGMEWLGEMDEEDIPPDDDFCECERASKSHNLAREAALKNSAAKRRKESTELGRWYRVNPRLLFRNVCLNKPFAHCMQKHFIGFQ